MTYCLERPAPAFDPATGALKAEHFQMAYVTNDIERACDLFARRLGIRAFTRIGGTNPQGGIIHGELAWVGTVMYEIVQAEGPETEIFSAHTPAGTDFAMVHHHLGYLIQNQQQWDGLLAHAARENWAIARRSVNSLMQVCFLQVPGLPHYLEYLYPNAAGLDFFNSVERS